jgi:hypothetical protein
MKNTYGLLFFGVPNSGIELSALQSILAMARDQPNEAFLHSLGSGQELIRTQRKHFEEAFNKKDFPKSHIYCYYETVYSPTARKVEAPSCLICPRACSNRVQAGSDWEMKGDAMLYVSRDSATHSRPGEDDNIQAIAKTHSDMVKFSQHDDDCNVVLKTLQELVFDLC